jgi:phosphoenolpyruvate synthase/pyruvate phosphate dikinase
MDSENRTILPLATDRLALALGGGKSRALAKLATAGLPVPAGFLVSTNAYKQFLDANELADRIQEAISAAKGYLSISTPSKSGGRLIPPVHRINSY